MTVTETSAEGLKREFTITVPAGEVEDKITRRLGEIARTVQIRGFRPGKVPLPLLRQRFGPSVRGEVLESAVQDSSAEAIREHNLRPALPPRVEIVSMAEGADLEYKISLEVLPEMPEPDFAALALERLVAEVPEEDIDRAVERIAEAQRKSEPVERPAETGDLVVADVVGRAGDAEIPGSRGEGRQIEIGGAGFLPGFTEQLVGAGAGETREVKITFPADYGNTELAGKEGVFEIAVKEVRQRQPAVIDDELAKEMALDSLAELRQEIRQRMQRDYDSVARQRLKQALLDKLAQACDFPVPPGMVEIEFQSIWSQYEAERKAREGAATPASGAAAPEASAPGPLDAAAMIAPEETALEGASDRAPATAEAAKPPADHEHEPASHHAISHPGSAAEPIDAAAIVAPEETALEGASDSEPAAADDNEEDEKNKAEFRRIAERRVRLGLLLAEVGRNNNITVSQEELNQALVQEARRHPGYERQVIDYYRNNPDATNNLRAPLFEEKVVDFIVELAKPHERTVTPQELMTGAEPEGAESAPV
ncbi:MAG TPA: trigger factor [Stellaceae bacterium]|nr:trigger factor [Stellaceae bacterium]